MTTMSNATTQTDRDGSVSPAIIDSFRETFESDPGARIAQNAITRTDINEIALNREIVTGTDFTFSTLLDEWEVTNQKRSGRCWLFAALNLLRVGAMKKMNLGEFELSQNYMFFWDKFERAPLLPRADHRYSRCGPRRPHRGVQLDCPMNDGGQWNMFMNLVRAHGIVPQAVMPETHSSSNSRRMNAHLEHKLREGAMRLRSLASEKCDVDEVVAAKEEILRVIWRMLCVHLGTPPTTFDWQWKRQGPQIPSRWRDDTARVRREVCRPAARRIRLPGPRPTKVEPGRAHLYGGSAGERGGWRARHLSQHRDRPHEIDRPIGPRIGRTGSGSGAMSGRRCNVNSGSGTTNFFATRSCTGRTSISTRQVAWTTTNRS